jgi:folate-binding Fe-S cluster repair protein YgfZ
MQVWRVSGKDAEDFLHRVTAGRVKGLQPGEGAGGLLLTGQSRMIAFFDLLREENGFLLAVPEACANALAEGLEKLHFAEDLEIELAPWKVNAVPGEEDKRESVFPFRGSRWPSAVPGYVLWLAESEEPWPASYDFDRIGASIPSARDWDSSTPALEAGVLPWIDRGKGCYPGQEVVERSLNVGHPARVLVAIEGLAPLSPREMVPLEGGGEGLVTSSASREGVTRAMLRLPWAKREAMPAGFRALKTEFP